MRRHITLLTTLSLGLVTTAACAAGSAEEGNAEAAETTAGTAEAAARGIAAASRTDQESACFLRGATPEEAQNRASPLRELRFTIGGEAGSGGTEALLCYGAPSKRDREIMGGLVPFGELWRAGANEATAIHLPVAATIGGVAVQPGSYSLYTIPGEEEWLFFLNSNWERWGIPVTGAVRATEVGSFTRQPEVIGETVEQLTYRYEDGALVMEWENTRVSLPVGPPGS